MLRTFAVAVGALKAFDEFAVRPLVVGSLFVLAGDTLSFKTLALDACLLNQALAKTTKGTLSLTAILVLPLDTLSLDTLPLGTCFGKAFGQARGRTFRVRMSHELSLDPLTLSLKVLLVLGEAALPVHTSGSFALVCVVNLAASAYNGSVVLLFVGREQWRFVDTAQVNL